MIRSCTNDRSTTDHRDIDSAKEASDLHLPVLCISRTNHATRSPQNNTDEYGKEGNSSVNFQTIGQITPSIIGDKVVINLLAQPLHNFTSHPFSKNMGASFPAPLPVTYKASFLLSKSSFTMMTCLEL